MLDLENDRYKLVIEALPHLIWELDTSGNITYITPNLFEWIGINASMIPDIEWKSFVHPEDADRVSMDWNLAIQDQHSFTSEFRIKEKDGNYSWFLAQTLPVKMNSGTISKWVGSATKIDEQKKIADDLRESEKKFRQLADVMPQQVWTANANGELEYVNEVTRNYFGKTEAEILGAGWQYVVHPADIDTVVKTWLHSLATLEHYQVEFRLKNKTGDYRWHLGRARHFIDNNNQVKWYGTNTDIEVHKYNEQKKDDFISMASHELKTPVTSIKGYAQILQNKFEKEGNTNAAELLKRMDTQVDKLNKLIGDFLSVSNIEGQHYQLNKANFSFKTLIEEGVKDIQHTSRTHNIIIERNEDISFFGDKLRLEQVINNFLNNAVKYSPGANKVIVNSYVQSDKIVVSIEDFGIGIENGNLTKIFDRFYRVDNTSMKFQGLGLGLYISSEIIKSHKGSFWIESQPGKGSTFYFLLPLNPDEIIKEVDTDNSTYHLDKQITIKYDKENNWLVADWIGFQNYDSVKRGCMIMLDLLKKNYCNKVLNDNTNVLGNWSEAADWGGTYWFPEMQKAGLEYFAWVYSPSTFSKLAAHKSLDVMAGNITTQFFTTVDEASEWLKKVGK